MTNIKDPTERRKVFVINLTLLSVFIILILASYGFRGLDFAKATLVGCVVVAINFFISQRLIGTLIFEKKLQASLLVAYFFKLGASVAILFVAVTELQMDIVGLMLGLSSILVSTVISTIVGKTPEIEES